MPVHDAIAAGLNGLTALQTVAGWDSVRIQGVLDELYLTGGAAPQPATLADLQDAATENPLVQGLIDHWTDLCELGG